MKRFIIKSALIVLIPVIAVTFLLLKNGDDRSKYSHEVNVALAYNRLDSLRGTKKIVIIAGSNGGFSIDSRIISDSMRLPVVNTSAHAGIGVRMQFEMYKDLLESGDIVIFCPEYYYDKRRLYGEVTLFRILSTHMPMAYCKMSLLQWINTFKYIGAHYQEAKEHAGCQPFDGPYSASSVNKFGDISCPREHKEIKDFYHLAGTMDCATTSYYQYIHEYTKNKGITLVYLPPALIETNYLDQKAQIDSLDKFMTENHIPFQARPERFVFNDSLFFDTPYHMTSQGASLRTRVMIEELKRIVGH